MLLVHMSHQKLDIYIYTYIYIYIYKIKALKASYHKAWYLVRRNHGFLWSPQLLVTQANFSTEKSLGVAELPELPCIFSSAIFILHEMRDVVL